MARLIKGLERVIGEERTKTVVNKRTYKWFADGVSVNIFSLSFMINETTLGGMNFYESLSTRGAAFFGNMVIGGPYVTFRNWTMKKLKIKKETSRYIKWPIEMVTFAIGQTPAYIGFLIAGNMFPNIVQGIATQDLDAILNSYQDINWEKVRNAATSLTLLSPGIGPAQGWTSDKVREQFGLETAYDNQILT